MEKKRKSKTHYRKKITYGIHKKMLPLQIWHNTIKEKIMSRHEGKTIILDLGSGKLNDLHNWKPNFIIHAVEIDKISINIGIHKYNKLKNKNYNFPKIFTYHCDVTSEKIFKILPENLKVDHIYCNFSFHYFYDDLEHFIQIAKKYLKPGGTINILCFDGDIIKQYLKTHNGKYKSDICEIWYTSNDKNKIYVKILSIGKRHIESLVYQNELKNIFGDNGIKYIDCTNFSEYFYMKVRNKFTKEKITLNKYEKEFSSFHMFMKFKMI